jgi:hypothetical protein
MSDDVAALIGCLSPASQLTTPPTTTTSPSVPTTTTAPTAPGMVTSSTPAAATFTCPPDGLSKDQLSMINDYEILVARANSKHTPVPDPAPEVAAFITCE